MKVSLHALMVMGAVKVARGGAAHDGMDCMQRAIHLGPPTPPGHPCSESCMLQTESPRAWPAVCSNEIQMTWTHVEHV